MQNLMDMSLPAIVGSVVTFLGILVTSRTKNKGLRIQADEVQDKVWLDIVKQSRIEYELQRKENNRLRYIAHHLQTEIQELEEKNHKLAQRLADLNISPKEVLEDD